MKHLLVSEATHRKIKSLASLAGLSIALYLEQMMENK